MFNDEGKIVILFEVVFDSAQNMNEAIELRKKVDNAIGCGEYLLPLLDQIGEYDHSKWMSICSTGSVVSFDGEYFSSAKIEFNMRQNASMEFLENLKQRFDDSDYYHVTRSLTDKIMPKGCHAEITDISILVITIEEWNLSCIKRVNYEEVKQLIILVTDPNASSI